MNGNKDLSAGIGALIAAQRLDEALAAVQAARAMEPQHLQWAIKHAEVLRLMQRPAEAMAVLTPLLEGGQDPLALRDELAVCLRVAGEIERSLQVADETLAGHPAHRPARRARIDALIAAQRLDEALAAVQAARALEPQHLHWAIKHAEVLRLMQRPAEAVAVLAPLLEGGQDPLALRDELAVCLRVAGEIERSLQVADETLAGHPAHRPARRARIDALIAAQRLDEALAAIRVARAMEPQHLPWTIKHAAVLRLMQRPAEAVALLVPLLEGGQGPLALRDELAVCLRVAGEIEVSLQVADETLAGHPAHRPALHARIDALIAAQRLDEALAAIRVARALEPQHLPWTIKHAAVLRLMQRPAEAVALLVPLLEGGQGPLALRDELAICLRLAGEIERSLQVADETLARHPAHLPAVLARIEALIAAGDQEVLAGLADSLIFQSDAGPPRPGQGQMALESLARIIPQLQGSDVPRRLIAAAEGFAASARLLRPEQLWQVYVAADQAGLGARYRSILDDLLARDHLPVGVCLGIVQALHRNGIREWRHIAEQMPARLAPPDRWRFRLECSELAEGAAAAVRTRGRGGRRTRPDDAGALARMLRSAGRLRLCARYLRRARRAWPWHADLFRAYIDCLAEIAAVDELHEVIRREDRLQAAATPSFLAPAATALLKMGDLPSATAFAARIAVPRQRAGLDRELLRSQLRRGENEAAEGLFAKVGKWLPRRSALHFGPGVDGVVRIDATLAQRSDAEADPRALLPAAGGVVRRWLEAHPGGASGGTTAVPRQVMQYWDKPEPPEDIAGLIATWQGQPGIAHQRFDRRRAAEWLGTRLGPDWRRALHAARSPAEESDFFRLAWLMLEGGLYVDGDDRLTGELDAVFARLRGLTVFLEPHGSIGNNVIFAPPLHPAIVWAAHAARSALLERHSDNTWMKTGPGLLTRAVAWYLTAGAGPVPDLSILPRYQLGAWMQVHVPLPYKRTNRYWNASGAGAGEAADLVTVARRLLLETAPAP